MWSWGRLGTRPQTMSRSRLDARSEGRGSMLDLDLDLELDSEPRSRSSSMPEPAQVLVQCWNTIRVHTPSYKGS